MVDAMRKGADLTVKGTSGRGTSRPTSIRSRAWPRRSIAPSRSASSALITQQDASSDASRRTQHDPCRHRRLDVRALARRVLSQGPAAGARARTCQPQAHRDRDQRHLLPHPEAGELPQVGGRDAGRFRVHAQGAALRHPPPRAGGGRRIDRALLRERRAGARRTSSGRSCGSCTPTKKFEPDDFARLSRAAAANSSKAVRSAMPSRCGTRASSMPPSSTLLRKLSVAAVLRRIRQASADRRRDRRFRLCAACSAPRKRKRPVIRRRRSMPGPSARRPGRAAAHPTMSRPSPDQRSPQGQARRLHLHDLGRQGARAGGRDGADRAAEASGCS